MTAPADREPTRNRGRYGCVARITARQQAVQELQQGGGTATAAVPDDGDA